MLSQRKEVINDVYNIKRALPKGVEHFDNELAEIFWET